MSRLLVRRSESDVGVGFRIGVVCVVLICLVLTAGGWWVAGRPVFDTEGLVAQYGALIDAAQLWLGASVAIATMYYARTSAQMARTMANQSAREHQVAVDSCAGQLIGAVLTIAATSGMTAAAMKQSWRWYLPSASRLRDDLVLRSTHRVQEALASALRWSEELAYRRPDLRDSANTLVSEALSGWDAALAGQVDRATRHAGDTRRYVDELRALLRDS